ncbi:ras-related protein RABD2a-like [Anneissia japonica]|uniref:ras-related protein RABD2a-like n=1 Tax=Anneissia japonica TaxID=1529436 RepID=UPI001425A29D|nr:ras-related protein RABD2a-like [Anneissia japonica]
MVSIANCPVLKIAVVGDPGVGKTTLLRKFMREDSTLMKSKFTDIQVKYVDRNGHKVKLEIRDTAGLERHRSLTRSYYQGVTSIIFMYDVNNRDSFDNLTKWNDQYTRNCRDPVNSQTLIVGNKRQLTNDTPAVPADTARNFANHLEADFIEVSTSNSFNIDECFFRLVDNFFETHSKRQPGHSSSRVDLNSRPKYKNGYCCL